MMRFAFALIASLVCSGYCLGQVDSSSVSLRWAALKIQALHDQHIDTVLCYHNGCPGCFFKKSKDTCAAYDDTRYLFWHKKRRYFACMVDKCGSHRIAPMDGRKWGIIMNDYAAIVKLNPADTYKDKTDSGTSEMTVFRSGDDIPEDVFELYLTSRHSLLDIDDGYLGSTSMNAEKPTDQTVEKIKEIKATINGVMGKYFQKVQ
jgi:hypothetical protein